MKEEKNIFKIKKYYIKFKYKKQGMYHYDTNI